jgi:putative transposase
MRKIKFQNEYYYHIYNRGVDKREIFLDDKDYIRFITSMREFNQAKPIGSLYRLNQLRRGTASLRFAVANRREAVPLVEIICYCLNPNHYHFILKQNTEKGISEFIKRLATGHTTYFNLKYNRSGSLF